MVGFFATKLEFSDWKKLKILYLFVGGNDIDSRPALGDSSSSKTEKLYACKQADFYRNSSTYGWLFRN